MADFIIDSPIVKYDNQYLKDLTELEISIHENSIYIIFKKFYNDSKKFTEINIDSYPELLTCSFTLKINYKDLVIDLSDQFKNLKNNYFKIDLDSDIEVHDDLTIEYQSKNSSNQVLSTFNFNIENIKTKFNNYFNDIDTESNDFIISKIDPENIKIYFINFNILKNNLNINEQDLLLISMTPMLLNISYNEIFNLKNIFRKNFLYNPYYNQNNIYNEFKKYICIFKIYQALDYQIYDFVKFKDDLFKDEILLSTKTLIYNYSLIDNKYYNINTKFITNISKYFKYILKYLNDDYITVFYFDFFSKNQNNYFNIIIQTQYQII